MKHRLGSRAFAYERIRDGRDCEPAPPEVTGVSFHVCRDARRQDVSGRPTRLSTRRPQAPWIPEDDTSGRPRPSQLSLVVLRQKGPWPMLPVRSTAAAGTPLTSEVLAPLPPGTPAPICDTFGLPGAISDTPVGVSRRIGAPGQRPRPHPHGPLSISPSNAPLQSPAAIISALNQAYQNLCGRHPIHIDPRASAPSRVPSATSNRASRP